METINLTNDEALSLCLYNYILIARNGSLFIVLRNDGKLIAYEVVRINSKVIESYSKKTKTDIIKENFIQDKLL